MIGRLGNLGIGSEQVDENKKPGELPLETAWANVWESNGKIVDNMLAFVDYDCNAKTNTFKSLAEDPERLELPRLRRRGEER